MSADRRRRHRGLRRRLGAPALRLVRSRPRRPDDHRLERVGRPLRPHLHLHARPDGTTDIDYVVVREGKNLKGRFLASSSRRSARASFRRRLSTASRRSRPGTTRPSLRAWPSRRRPSPQSAGDGRDEPANVAGWLRVRVAQRRLHRRQVVLGPRRERVVDPQELERRGRACEAVPDITNNEAS